ncbi:MULTISPECIES: dUTP diphosphatase [Selenomonas]|uniref:dUTP diphosphatase n=1 Tax=Selenomonas ruminis TaxID=2593411 RepID=A0A5D6W972_9FIRM|nr:MULTISPECIES: dUTP diphosphatase [unclassified Selenomonas]MBQ1868522.1 dUTP diphosphatase [Selenomonas sp.]TYZ25041.1 dUTP diphosphatase [Selenomonas sp. mPRGC5]
MKVRGFECVSDWQDKGIHLPERKTASSAGYDIEAGEDAIVKPGELTMVPTGVKAYMQSDEVLMIHIRSSMAIKQQLVLMNSVGVVDSDYYNNEDNEGHIFIAFWNRGTKPVAIQKGERIAQGIFQKYLTADDDVAGEGARRQGGFGSTGKA